jgi:hypothetical protein
MPDGSFRDYQFRDEYEWRFKAPDGAVCKRPGLPRPADDTPIGPPIVRELEECIWSITPMDAYVDNEGIWHTYFVIASNNPAICGGPYSYWSSRSGPQWDEPDTPFPPTPDPPTVCREGPAGPPGPQGPAGPKGDPGEGGCSCDHIDNKFAELTAKLDNYFDKSFDGAKYQMISVCEKDASGEPISEAVEVEIDSLKAPDAQIARLDAIVELLQAHKNFKQPICGNEKPELLGEWVTTRWWSDEKMVDSGRRLRKLFRYRTQSSRDLGQLSAYWRDFTWKSGPVCVIHKGAWWGTPQIWAESTEEGQRVIRHAATEAGLDPDQAGRWTISSSRSPRNGMSGTMRIQQFKGFPWVASRQGTDWPNYLAS